jgi:hypothetical protein
LSFLSNRGSCQEATWPRYGTRYGKANFSCRRLGQGRDSRQYPYEDQLQIGTVLNAAGTITYRFMYGSKPHVPNHMIKSGRQAK